jgi:hypothetical protein
VARKKARPQPGTGMQIPPYHPACRTSARPLDEADAGLLDMAAHAPARDNGGLPGRAYSPAEVCAVVGSLGPQPAGLRSTGPIGGFRSAAQEGSSAGPRRPLTPHRTRCAVAARVLISVSACNSFECRNWTRGVSRQRRHGSHAPMPVAAAGSTQFPTDARQDL